MRFLGLLALLVLAVCLVDASKPDLTVNCDNIDAAASRYDDDDDDDDYAPKSSKYRGRQVERRYKSKPSSYDNDDYDAQQRSHKKYKKTKQPKDKGLEHKRSGLKYKEKRSKVKTYHNDDDTEKYASKHDKSLDYKKMRSTYTPKYLPAYKKRQEEESYVTRSAKTEAYSSKKKSYTPPSYPSYRSKYESKYEPADDQAIYEPEWKKAKDREEKTYIEPEALPASNYEEPSVYPEQPQYSDYFQAVKDYTDKYLPLTAIAPAAEAAIVTIGNQNSNTNSNKAKNSESNSATSSNANSQRQEKSQKKLIYKNKNRNY